MMQALLIIFLVVVLCLNLNEKIAGIRSKIGTKNVVIEIFK